MRLIDVWMAVITRCTQVIGIGRAPAIRLPISVALARDCGHEQGKHGALARHVLGQARLSLRHWPQTQPQHLLLAVLTQREVLQLTNAGVRRSWNEAK